MSGYCQDCGNQICICDEFTDIPKSYTKEEVLEKIMKRVDKQVGKAVKKLGER